jgi:hypothetical protein
VDREKLQGFNWREDWPGPGELFLKTPHRMFTTGLVATMGNAEFKRYQTLLWVANAVNSNAFRIDVKDLERIDGVSPRRARDVNIKLEERGLILIERDTKPYRYVLLLVSEWKHGEAGIALERIGECVTIQGGAAGRNPSRPSPRPVAARIAAPFGRYSKLCPK